MERRRAARDGHREATPQERGGHVLKPLDERAVAELRAPVKRLPGVLPAVAAEVGDMKSYPWWTDGGAPSYHTQT